MGRSSRWFATVVVFTLASVVNPGYFSGCASDDYESPGDDPEKFFFGEAEMLDLVDEANAAGPYEIKQGGETYRVELTLSQALGEDQDDSAILQPPAAFASRAYACGTRTFMQSASACITISRVELHALVSVYKLGPDSETEIARDEELNGNIWVGGQRLTGAEIDIGSQGQLAGTQITLRSEDAKSFSLTHLRTSPTDKM